MLIDPNKIQEFQEVIDKIERDTAEGRQTLVEPDERDAFLFLRDFWKYNDLVVSQIS